MILLEALEFLLCSRLIRVIPVFYTSRGKDVSMLVDIILGTYMFYPLVLYDVGVSPFYYATVKRPTSSPSIHLWYDRLVGNDFFRPTRSRATYAVYSALFVNLYVYSFHLCHAQL